VAVGGALDLDAELDVAGDLGPTAGMAAAMERRRSSSLTWRRCAVLEAARRGGRRSWTLRDKPLI
jgi:hypothetical protein